LRALIGLGNPGRRYESTRHNAGFLFLDYFSATKCKKNFIPSKFEFDYIESEIEGNVFLLVKPVTYMNASGVAASQVSEHYGVQPSDMLIIYDELQVPIGTSKVSLRGGDGGHNGVSSVIEHLNTTDFPRLRIGIGRESGVQNMVDYVLNPFEESERPLLSSVFDSCVKLAEAFVLGGSKRLLDTHSALKQIKPDDSLSTSTNLPRGN